MKKQEQKIEPMDVAGMMRLLQFAMYGIGHELAKQQDTILKVEKWGVQKAVTNPIFFNPLRHVDADEPLEKMKQRHDELQAFAHKVQAMLDHVHEVDAEIWAQAMKQYFEQKHKS